MVKRQRASNSLRALLLLFILEIILSQGFLGYGQNITSDLLPQNRSLDLSTSNSTLTVETLPSTPNIPVLLNGLMYYTGSNGTLSLSLPGGNYVLEAIGETLLSENTKATFVKWGDLFDPQSFESERTITLTGDKVVRLLLAIHHRVSIVFTDSGVTKVNSSLVDSALVGASDGQSYLLRTYENLWFPKNRFQRVQDPITWKVVNITYTFNEVNVLGRNTVQRGLHSFMPSPDAAWNVPLQLYSLSVIVTDFFFGFPLDSEIQISDLSSGDMVLTSEVSRGQFTSEVFPRGNYMISIKGAGVALPAPVIFTKTMSVEVKVLSTLDIMFLVTIVVVFAGAVLVRRRHYASRRSVRR